MQRAPRVSRRILHACALAALVGVGCSGPVERNGKLLRAEPLMGSTIQFQFAVYYLPTPSVSPLPILRQELEKLERAPELVDQFPEAPVDLFVSPALLENVSEEYAPLDIESLQYFGRGLSREQAEALQKSERALVMSFAHPKELVWAGLRTANEIAVSVAQQTGGLLWDEQTREVFTPDEWRRARIDTWTEEYPDISTHTTIHAYQSGTYVRAITLGMSKVGLPDVVVQEFAWSLNRTMGHLINVVCQRLAEGATLEEPGAFELDLRAIETTQVRDPQLESLAPDASGVASLTFREGVWEEGDPHNRLIEIGFDHVSGPDVHAQQDAMLATLFGSEDAVVSIDHDEELLSASRRARAQLPTLYTAFHDGLDPGEFIQVKAPFATPAGGNEWMWVEVTSWTGTKIQGLLRNEPFEIPALHAGQSVEVDQDDVFDYIRNYPDGTREGNETGAIIERMQQ